VQIEISLTGDTIKLLDAIFAEIRIDTHSIAVSLEFLARLFEKAFVLRKESWDTYTRPTAADELAMCASGVERSLTNLTELLKEKITQTLTSESVRVLSDRNEQLQREVLRLQEELIQLKGQANENVDGRPKENVPQSSAG